MKPNAHPACISRYLQKCQGHQKCRADQQHDIGHAETNQKCVASRTISNRRCHHHSRLDETSNTQLIGTTHQTKHTRLDKTSNTSTHHFRLMKPSVKWNILLHRYYRKREKYTNIIYTCNVSQIKNKHDPCKTASMHTHFKLTSHRQQND
jgi:hypothetical protein